MRTHDAARSEQDRLMSNARTSHINHRNALPVNSFTLMNTRYYSNKQQQKRAKNKIQLSSELRTVKKRQRAGTPSPPVDSFILGPTVINNKVPRGGSGESRYCGRWWHASCLPLPLALALKQAWRAEQIPLARLKRGLLWPRRLCRSCPRLAPGIARTRGEKHGGSGGAQRAAACRPLPLGPSCPSSPRRSSAASLAAHGLRMPKHANFAVVIELITIIFVK